MCFFKDMDKTPFISTAGAFTSWSISQINEWVGLGIGLLTVIYIVLKIKTQLIEQETKNNFFKKSVDIVFVSCFCNGGRNAAMLQLTTTHKTKGKQK